MDTAKRATNPAVAARIGTGETQVSRLRAGHRGFGPSPALMIRIRDAYGWSVDAQVDAMANGTYGSEFERVIAESTPAA